MTATLSSPSLQVRELTQVTDSNGNYRFVDLPAGTYKLKLDLSGFSALIREDLRLTVGFVARVDEALKVGVMSESVTVSGQSPVVDVTSTSASVAFTKEMLDTVPRGRDLQNVLAMAPGVTQVTLDVGGSTLAQRQDTASYGMAAQPKLHNEGRSAADTGCPQRPARSRRERETLALTANLPGRSGMDSGDTTLTAGTTPLMRAARAGDTAVIRLLLEKGADPTLATQEWQYRRDVCCGCRLPRQEYSLSGSVARSLRKSLLMPDSTCIR